MSKTTSSKTGPNTTVRPDKFPLKVYLLRFLRRLCGNEKSYRLLRRSFLFAQYLLRRPDDPDFLFLKAMKHNSGGLIVDVGANGGHAAIAFGFLYPNYRILSVEPNPSLWPDLKLVKRLLGKRYTYKPIGLGKNNGEYTLYIPVCGNLPITTRASIHRDIAEQQVKTLTLELEKPGSVEEIQVNIQRFDDLNLQPDAVKIDVEGHELAVLEGMSETIEKHSPIFLIEKNDNTPDCQRFLNKFQYEFFNLDTRSLCLTVGNKNFSSNWVAVPYNRIIEFNICRS